MTISELTLKSSDVEPVRRFEVFTGIRPATGLAA